MIVQNCPECGKAMSLPDNIRIGDGVICPHCGGDLVYDRPTLPQSITNPDQFAKEFARRILDEYPYKPPSGRYFCSLDSGCNPGPLSRPSND